MVGATIAELGTFKVGLLPLSYDASYRGVYTLDVSYSWYQPWLIVTRTFVWTLNDPCPTAISTPASFADLNLTLQKANSQQDVSALISIPQFQVCFYSINVSIVKAGVTMDMTPNAGNPIEFV